jgi:hypothetical protein
MDSLSTIDIYAVFVKDARVTPRCGLRDSMYRQMNTPCEPHYWYSASSNTVPKLVGLQKAARSVFTYATSRQDSARLFLGTILEEALRRLLGR